jgi:hypothetical protein
MVLLLRGCAGATSDIVVEPGVVAVNDSFTSATSNIIVKRRCLAIGHGATRRTPYIIVKRCGV